MSNKYIDYGTWLSKPENAGLASNQDTFNMYNNQYKASPRTYASQQFSAWNTLGESNPEYMAQLGAKGLKFNNDGTSNIKDLINTDDSAMSGFQKWQAGLGAANLAYSAFISDPRERAFKNREVKVQEGLLKNKQDEFDLTKERLARQYAAADTLSKSFGGRASTGTKYSDRYFN